MLIDFEVDSVNALSMLDYATGNALTATMYHCGLGSGYNDFMTVTADLMRPCVFQGPKGRLYIAPTRHIHGGDGINPRGWELAYTYGATLLTLRYDIEKRRLNFSVLFNPQINNADIRYAADIYQKALTIAMGRHRSQYPFRIVESPLDFFRSNIKAAYGACTGSVQAVLNLSDMSTSTTAEKAKELTINRIVEMSLFNKLSETSRAVLVGDPDKAEQIEWMLPVEAISPTELEYENLRDYVPQATAVLGNLPLIGKHGEMAILGHIMDMVRLMNKQEGA